jgi:hypothetical protein
MGARQGDCQTLADMYVLVAHQFGLAANRQSRYQRQLIAPRPIHGRSQTANTEGNTAWYFFEHHWVIAVGTAYDVLFMTSPPPVPALRTAYHERHRVTYYVFSDGRCLIESREADDLHYPIGGIGRVFANEQATRDFIDLHTRRGRRQ